MRPGLIVPLVVALLAGVSAEAALAAHTETGPSWEVCGAGAVHARTVHGHVAIICYESFEHRAKNGKVTDVYAIPIFRFTSRCSPTRGSAVPGKMAVGKRGHFGYDAHGFTVTGTVVGMTHNPPHKISGTAQVVTTSCNSGPVAFSIRF